MRLSLLAAAFALILGSPAWAQTAEVGANDPLERVFAHRCGEVHDANSCRTEVQRRVRERFGLTDAEMLAEQGVTLRRAMFVDGWDNELVAVTFSRSPGHPPTVEISTPRAVGEDDPQPLSGVVSDRVWTRAMAASKNFDQTLETEGDSGLPVFCPDAGLLIVEVVDAARLNQSVSGQQMNPAEIRRSVEIDCGVGLVADYAYLLAQIAMDNLPECSSIDRGIERGDGRNDEYELAFCQQLRGDRLAAADAHRSLQALESRAFDSLLQGEEFAWEFFAESAEHLAAPFRAAVAGGHFYFGPPHATDVDHATVKGQVIWPLPEIGKPGESYEADIKLELIRQSRRFVILSYELSPRRPSRP